MNQREIKFRAWDKKEKQWEEVEYIDMEGTPYWFDVDSQEVISYPYSENIILMQYTGLKDKNGKEIYEGDIMCFKCEKQTKDGGHLLGTDNFYPENSVIIKFERGRFFGEELGGHQREMPELLNTKYIIWEVIGNIYENPELLK